MKMRYFAPNTHTLDSWLHSQKMEHVPDVEAFQQYAMSTHNTDQQIHTRVGLHVQWPRSIR